MTPDQQISAPLPAHGGELRNLYVGDREREELLRASRDWPSVRLSARQVRDLELLMNGAFSPLEGFQGRESYEGVLQHMRLADGTLWPIPITLDVGAGAAEGLQPGTRVALRDAEGVMLAALEVSDRWRPDCVAEAEAIFGTADEAHPGVRRLREVTGEVYLGGRIFGLQAPAHYDFPALRQSPDELRRLFKLHGWRRVVAFQTRNPLHRAHQELTLRAAKEARANLLIHPVVGLTKAGDVDHYTRVRCYQSILHYYPEHTVMLSLLPLAMRMAGPREALWHAIVRKNYGCSHFIVGRDHAGPGADADGKPFYGPYEAQELLAHHQEELGVTMVPFRHLVYVEDRDAYLPEDGVREGERVLQISGTGLRRRLAEGREIPSWYTFPEVARELRRTYPPRSEQGFTVFFTGLSGAGKSTIANVVLTKLLEIGGRPVTLLDGDIVRTHLSSELGFSKEHRDLNIRRIGFVASEITKNGGIALCAPIAPYSATRRQVREMISPGGGFVLVHVATPLEVCEDRDRKGLYAKARAGLIEEFTGISDPYEAPEDAELVIDTSDLSPEEAAQEILLFLEGQGYLGGPEASWGGETHVR